MGANQPEQARLVLDRPLRISRTVMRQHGGAFAVGPRAQPCPRRRHQLLDDGRSKYFEEEIFVRLAVAPADLRFVLDLGSGADRDEDGAVRPGSLQRRSQSAAVEPRALDDNGP